MDAAPSPPQLAKDGSDSAVRAQSTFDRPRKKRQKISLACEECRARKVRCDGVRPQCGTCRRRNKTGRQCIYLSDASKSMDRTKETQALYDRLAYLEAKFGHVDQPNMSHRGDVGVDIPQEASQAHSPMLNSDPSSIQPPRCDKASAAAVQEETHIDPRLSTPQSSVGDNETLVPDRGSACHEIGAINAMGMAQLTPDSQADADNRLFSNPSAASLLCNIQDQCQQQSRSSVIYQDPATETPQPARRKLSTLHSQNDDDYHLPPRNVADHLLRLYWERVQNVYPFLHWPTLEAAYKRLWLSESEIAQLPELVGVGIGSRSCSVVVFYCAINAIFALASQFTEGLEHERKERSLPFVRRSRHLMRLDFLDNADICLVQALLVFARYLQTTNFPSRCRNVVGVAYRMAQSLDLGNEVDRGEMSMLEIEMRRRVWHSCTSLDTVLGMLIGKACCNSYMSKVPLPRVADEEISACSMFGSAHPSSATQQTDFFCHAITLGQILSGILNQVYEPWRGLEAKKVDTVEEETQKLGSELISAYIRLDQDLAQFETGLPESLSNTANSFQLLHDTAVLQQQRHVLWTRYLHIRCLLHRPLFVQLCRRRTSQDAGSSQKELRTRLPWPLLYQAIVERSATACIQNAQLLIDHISDGSVSGTAGSPWYTCYYIYHAAMIIVLAYLCSKSMPQVDQVDLLRSWHTCEATFQRMAGRDPASYEYFRGLENIFKFIKSHNSGTDPGGENVGSGVEEHDSFIDRITSPCLDYLTVFPLDLTSNVEFDGSAGNYPFWALT